ncbi:hypothetical protein J3E69DRAFT_368451 [Trichoderma sp. SZMC 28015]
MSSAPASTLAIDILARFPAEIINRILDKLHPSLIYFHLFVEPKSAPVQSSSEECQRVREICISHNVKHGRMDILTYAVSSNNQETVKQMLEEASINTQTSDKKPTAVEHAPWSPWKVWINWCVNKGQLDISRQLLCLGGIANYLNLRNLMGQTALHRALSKDGHRKTPLMLCLTKMAGLNDMTLYIPTFKQLLVVIGADPQAFSTQYETVLKDVLDEYDSAFRQELIEQTES